MSIDPWTLVAGLFVSTVGFVFFRYGKSMDRIPQLLTGLVLMGFPYFTNGPISTLGIAAGLVAGLWIGLRFGL